LKNADEIISIEYTAQLTNNIGRNVDNAKVDFYLPLYSNIKKIDDNLKVEIADQGHSFISLLMENVVANETKSLFINAAFSMQSQNEAFQSVGSGYIYDANTLKNTDSLLKSLESTNTSTEFLQQNPNIQAVLFLASVLSTQEQKVRIVSGIKFLEQEKQRPTCWIQKLKGNQWVDISVDKKKRLPFKVMLPQTDIDEHSCQNSIIEVWGLHPQKLQITLIK